MDGGAYGSFLDPNAGPGSLSGDQVADMFLSPADPNQLQQQQHSMQLQQMQQQELQPLEIAPLQPLQPFLAKQFEEQQRVLQPAPAPNSASTAKNRRHSSNARYRAVHNASEKRRRVKLKEKFAELQQVTQTKKKDQSSILESAISQLNLYKQRVMELEEEQNRLQNQMHRATGDGSNIMHDPILNVLPIAYINIDGSFRDCNEAFAQYMGFTREEIVATNNITMFSLTHREDLAETFKMVQSLMSGEKSNWVFDKKCVRKDGDVVTTHILTTLVKELDDHGVPVPSYIASFLVPATDCEGLVAYIKKYPESLVTSKHNTKIGPTG